MTLFLFRPDKLLRVSGVHFAHHRSKCVAVMSRLYYRGAVRGVRSLGEVSKVYLFSLSGNLSRCVSRLPPRQCSEPGCRALRGAQPPCRRRDRCGHPSAITAPDTAADGPAHCPPNHTSLSIEHNQHPTALDSNCPPRGPHRSRRPSSLPHPLAYLDGLPTPSPAGPPTPLSQSLYYSHSGQLPPRT